MNNCKDTIEDFYNRIFDKLDNGQDVIPSPLQNWIRKAIELNRFRSVHIMLDKLNVEQCDNLKQRLAMYQLLEVKH